MGGKCTKGGKSSTDTKETKRKVVKNRNTKHQKYGSNKSKYISTYKI